MAVLVLLQWAAFAVDLAVPQVVVIAYLGVPVVVSALLGRPRWSALLAVQGSLLGLVGTVLNDYLATVQGWVRLVMLVAVSLIGWILAVVLARSEAQRRIAVDQLAESELHYRLLATETTDVVFRVDSDGLVEWVSPSVQPALGYPPQALVGTRTEGLLDAAEGARLRADLMDDIRAGRSSRSILRVHCADGSARWMEAQSDALPAPFGGRVVRLRDVDQQVAATKDLEHQARTDALTGLLNRREVLHRVQGLTRGRRAGTGTAVLFVDVDRLKEVNDARGHSAGDAVLTAVAARLVDVVRSTDLVGRLGGDEFLVGLGGVSSLEEAVEVAEKAHRACSEPVRIPDGAWLRPSVSIGVALLADGEDHDDLVRRADQALYRAKAGGRGRVATEPEQALPGRG